MKKADSISNKLNNVRTVVSNKSCEPKHQTTSETSNLESTSSSYITKKRSRIDKLKDGRNKSSDADNVNRVRNIEGTFYVTPHVKFS